MPELLTEHLSLYPERCLNSRSNEEFCRRCVEVCPERAIELAEEGIRFDAERCHECALCAIDCPTGAYAHAGFAATWLAGQASGRAELNLYCQFSGGDRGDGLLIPCHGLLNERALLGLYAAGVRMLCLHGLDGCEACPSRVGERRLDAAMAMAAVRPEIVRMVRGDAEAPAGAAVNRRGFIGQMGKGMAYAAMQTLPDALQADGARHVVPGPHGLLAKHLPDRQRLALDLLAKGRAEISWFYQLQAGDVCDLCNICSFACPTGALVIVESDDRRSLRHRPDACVGCGLCLSLCPHGALRYSAVDQELLRRGGCITLQEQTQAKCRACGAGFPAAEGDQQLCQRCEREQFIRSQWLNG